MRVRTYDERKKKKEFGIDYEEKKKKGRSESGNKSRTTFPVYVHSFLVKEQRANIGWFPTYLPVSVLLRRRRE